MTAHAETVAASRQLALAGWLLIVLGLAIAISIGWYLWAENWWVGTVGAAGATAPSSIPLYLTIIFGLGVAATGVGLVVTARSRSRVGS